MKETIEELERLKADVSTETIWERLCSSDDDPPSKFDAYMNAAVKAVPSLIEHIKKLELNFPMKCPKCMHDGLYGKTHNYPTVNGSHVEWVNCDGLIPKKQTKK